MVQNVPTKCSRNILCCTFSVGNTTLACDFENSALCAYTSDPTGQFRWTRSTGRTTSSQTGPSSDHTYGTAVGHYLYIEASAPRQSGDKARLVSADYSPIGSQCLEFWYNMYGRDTGTLNVYLKKGTNLGSPVLTKQGNKCHNKMHV